MCQEKNPENEHKDESFWSFYTMAKPQALSITCTTLEFQIEDTAKKI